MALPHWFIRQHRQAIQGGFSLSANVSASTETSSITGDATVEINVRD
jgi:hypothetical protein